MIKRVYLYSVLAYFLPAAAVYTTMTSNEPKTINQENERYVAGFSGGSPQMGIAFDSLKLQFPDPNDFKIETSLSLIRDSVWTITFAYSLPQEKLKERYATFVVRDSVARMMQFNRSQAELQFVHIADKMKRFKEFADSVEAHYEKK
jgi:hypothetical protein